MSEQEPRLSPDDDPYPRDANGDVDVDAMLHDLFQYLRSEPPPEVMQRLNQRIDRLFEDFRNNLPQADQ